MTLETSRHQVAEVVRMALDAGKTVEIEGLGTFQVAAEDHGYRFESQIAPEIFLAYVGEDLAPARRLCEALRAQGFSPWLDKDELLPGQNWPRAIERAIENSDAFVACFSTRSIVKRGQFQSELRYALDCARQRPLDQTFLIPVRLEECAVPRRISNQVQYVDLFPDWHKGVRRIARSIRKAARNRPVAEFV
jgi:TIR domain-containing protein